METRSLSISTCERGWLRPFFNFRGDGSLPDVLGFPLSAPRESGHPLWGVLTAWFHGAGSPTIFATPIGRGYSMLTRLRGDADGNARRRQRRTVARCS